MSPQWTVPIILDLQGKARRPGRPGFHVSQPGSTAHSVQSTVHCIQAGSTVQSSQLGSTVDSARLHSAQCTVPGSILVHRQAPLSQFQCSALSYLGHSFTSMLHSAECTVHSYTLSLTRQYSLVHCTPPIVTVHCLGLMQCTTFTLSTFAMAPLQTRPVWSNIYPLSYESKFLQFSGKREQFTALQFGATKCSEMKCSTEILSAVQFRTCETDP